MSTKILHRTFEYEQKIVTHRSLMLERPDHIFYAKIKSVIRYMVKYENPISGMWREDSLYLNKQTK
jgi:hypothetical protein